MMDISDEEYFAKVRITKCMAQLSTRSQFSLDNHE